MNALIIFYFLVVIAIGAEAGFYFSKPRSSNTFSYWLHVYLAMGIVVPAGYLGIDYFLPFAMLAVIVSFGMAQVICWHVESKRHEQKLKKRELRKKQLPQPKSSRRFAQRR